MARKPLILAALSLVLVLATACSSPQSVVLTATNNGGKAEVQVGGRILIELSANPSTGYTWEAKDLDASMFQQIGDPTFTSSSPGQVGSDGTLTLTFKALKAGTSTLTLVYHRPWETSVAPINTFSVTLTLK